VACIFRHAVPPLYRHKPLSVPKIIKPLRQAPAAHQLTISRTGRVFYRNREHEAVDCGSSGFGLRTIGIQIFLFGKTTRRAGDTPQGRGTGVARAERDRADQPPGQFLVRGPPVAWPEGNSRQKRPICTRHRHT
jgi:hypothetical protein